MPIKALNPEHIEVLCWNIAKGRHPSWQHDLDRFSRHVDLALLQEAKLEHSMHDALPDCCWAFAPGYSRMNHTTGVLTAARAETVNPRAHAHREPITGLPKAALITEYRLDGRDDTLMVANVHAINFTPGTAHFRRQLHAITVTLGEHRGPLLVCGDFNTWRQKRVLILHELIEALGLAALGFDQDLRRLAFGLALDHIFFRGMEATSGVVTRVMTSDHNPINAVLRVR